MSAPNVEAVQASETAPSKYAPLAGKIPGTTVNLGGHDLVLAPLTAAHIKEFASVVENLGKKETLEENLNDAFPIILASLWRNYPDFTLNDVRSLIDLGNLHTAIAAVVGVGGPP